MTGIGHSAGDAIFAEICCGDALSGLYPRFQMVFAAFCLCQAVSAIGKTLTLELVILNIAHRGRVYIEQPIKKETQNTQ